MFSAASRNRVFLLTMARIWAAYRTGAMRYLVFVARKEANREQPANTSVNQPMQQVVASYVDAKNR